MPRVGHLHHRPRGICAVGELVGGHVKDKRTVVEGNWLRVIQPLERDVVHLKDHGADLCAEWDLESDGAGSDGLVKGRVRDGDRPFDLAENVGHLGRHHVDVHLVGVDDIQRHGLGGVELDERDRSDGGGVDIGHAGGLRVPRHAVAALVERRLRSSQKVRDGPGAGRAAFALLGDGHLGSEPRLKAVDVVVHVHKSVPRPALPRDDIRDDQPRHSPCECGTDNSGLGLRGEVLADALGRRVAV